jgi:hypothetical protein
MKDLTMRKEKSLRNMNGRLDHEKEEQLKEHE